MDAARSGDWDAAERAATALSEQPVPDGRDALRGHLRDLREALIVARACRAGLYQSANRLAAAARFQRLAVEAPGSGAASQNPGEATEF